MDLKPFLRYWSLTFAVFVFYLFALLVAAMDIFDELAEAARKRRAAARGPALDPNPLAGKTVAQTLLPGPGQRLNARRQWVAALARELVARLGAEQRIKTVVLEDSKGHALVHFSDGKRVESYRVDRTLVDSAMAGEAAKVNEVKELLARHLSADFLGMESIRPPRLTELAREAAPKAGAAAAAPVAAAPPVPAAPAAPAAAAPASPPAPSGGAQLSREERLAAARAKAEALKKARSGQAPPGQTPPA